MTTPNDDYDHESEKRVKKILSEKRVKKFLIGRKERQQIERLKKVGISLDPKDFEKTWGTGGKYPDDFPAKGGAS